MALPPDPNQIPLDNQDDPLGGMDPLAWLESLARRQGVDPNQLTTDADLDIPMPDANAVVDGPGYTPGYDVITPETTHISAPPPAAAFQPPTPAPEPEAQPPIQAEVATPTPAAEIDPMSDPLAWLESLAKRQGVDPSQLTTSADLDIPMPAADAVVDGPGYTPGYDLYPSSSDSAQQEPAQAEAEPVHDQSAPPAPEPVMAVPPAQEPAPAEAIDPMSDPIAFMESLARNMGADPSQFTTKADLKIERPPEDAVVDGPGYTPGYDLYPSAPEPAEPPVPVQPPAPPAPTPVEQPAATTATQQPLISAQPDQPDLPPPRPTPFVPARPSPFVPAVPPPAPSAPAPEPVQLPAAVVPPAAPPPAPAPVPAASEPTTQQPAAIVPLPPPSAPPAPEQQPVAAATPSLADLPDISDPLAWLESLTTPHPTSNMDFASEQSDVDTEGSMTAEEALAWLEQLTHDNQPVPPLTAQDQSWLNVQPTKVDESGGLSDDMDEIQRWLSEQANSLGDLHDLPENDLATAAPDEPARPVQMNELPDWLRAQEPGGDSDLDIENILPLSDTISAPPIPSDLPDWLMQNIEQPADDQAVSLPILPAQEEEYDPWIAALEEEETRQQAGDDSLPDWYTEALARHGALPPALEAGNDLVANQPVEQAVTEPADVLRANELPDWLSAMAPEDNQQFAIPAIPEPEPVAPAIPESAEPEPAFEDEIPAWLREAAPTPAETAPLAQLATPAQDSDLPDWLRGSGEATLPPPTPEPAQIPQPEPVATLPPAPTPAAPPPVRPPAPPSQPEPAAATAGFDPGYHLQQAQYHASQQNYKDSLAHYQTLIDKSAALDDVIVGVKEVVAAQPKDPRARRLLGDAHLRQGNLQEALDTYRSALNNM